MTATLVPVVDAVASARAALDALIDADYARVEDAGVVAALREVERVRATVTMLDCTLLAQVSDRQLASSRAARDEAGWLAGELSLRPGEAAARVTAARDLGPRRALTGEPLEPVFPATAAALRAATITAVHARVIVKAVDALPTAIQAEHGVTVERDLVGFAATLGPRELERCAARIHAHLDPDGSLRDLEYRHQRRHLTVCQRPDGSATIRGEATAELAEHLLVHLDVHAKPGPAIDGTPDPRSAGQRRHDALLASLKLVERDEKLPRGTGITTTIVVTMTDQAYRTGTGLAETSHGADVPVAEVLRWGGGNETVLAAAVDDAQSVLAYSGENRIFTRQQRIALQATYRGCTFPGCDVPIPWCEIHHIQQWARGGKTTLPNGAPLCAYHHRHFQQLGWECVKHPVDDKIEFLPPSWLDPDRIPRRNRSMHRDDVLRPSPG